MNQELQIPETSVYMQTNRDFRLSSLNGCVINFKANEPALVPPHVYREAIGIGAVLAEVEQPAAKEEEPKASVTSIAEAAKAEAEAERSYVTQACLALIAKGDDGDFKADGYPKLLSVVRELAPECAKPTAGLVMEIYDELREHADLIEND